MPGLLPGVPRQTNSWLRQAKVLFVYCSGPSCHDSRDLALRLWGEGLKNILLYAGGMEDWTGGGHAVER